MDIFWKCAHFLYKRGGNYLGRLFELISFAISSNAISAQAEIGEGTVFFHHGLGTVVHEKTVIGKECRVFQNVTIGQKHSQFHQEDGIPVIGDYVQIGAGACLLGNIKIGDHAVIGANAVVIHDVPENAVVVGVPGKIVR